MRTAFGLGFLTWIFLVFFAGSSDRFFVFLGISYEAQIWFWRFGVVIFPALVAVAAYRSCKSLQRFEEVEATRAAAEVEAKLGRAAGRVTPADVNGAG